MEELISRPFVGQIQFQLVLQKHISTESAIGCLVFSLALTFLFPRSLPCSKQLFKSMKNGSHPPMHHTPLDSAPRGEASDTPTTHASHPRSQPEQTQLPHQFVHFFKTPFSNWISLNLQSYLRPEVNTNTLEKLLWSWQTYGKQKSERERKTKQPIADSMPMSFCSTNRN